MCLRPDMEACLAPRQLEYRVAGDAGDAEAAVHAAHLYMYVHCLDDH